MNARSVATYMRCFREGGSRKRDALFVKAVRLAEKDNALRQELEQQLAFDRWVRDQVAGLPVPPEATAELVHAAAAHKPRVSWKHPALLAVVLAMLLTVGVLAYLWWEGRDDFDGRATLELMVEDATGAEEGWEQISGPIGELADWMFMKNVEGYAVPAAFAGYTAEGGRVFQSSDLPVVQIAVHEKAMHFFLFKKEAINLRLAREQGWRLFEANGWAVAVRTDGSDAFMVALPGTRSELETELQKAEP